MMKQIPHKRHTTLTTLTHPEPFSMNWFVNINETKAAAVKSYSTVPTVSFWSKYSLVAKPCVSSPA